jgi:hypothetical protein
MNNDNGDDKITPHAKGCRVMIFRKQKMPGHEGPGSCERSKHARRSIAP